MQVQATLLLKNSFYILLLFLINIDAFSQEKKNIKSLEVNLENIEKITSFYTNVGVSGGCQTLFYAKLNESMKIHNGGGINDEEIELMFLPVDDF